MEYNKKTKLNELEKRYLIEAIKKNPIIWDKSHPERSQRKILRVAWEKVAKEININEDTCRIAWKSIRDSQRYYRNKANKSNAGSTIDLDYSSDDSFAKPPPFFEEMKFLEEPTSNCSDDRRINMSPEECVSSFSYRSNSPTYRRSSCLNESMFDVVEIVEYKEEKRDNNSSSNYAEPPRKLYVQNLSRDLMTGTKTTTVDKSAASSPTKASYSYRSNTNAMEIKGRKVDDTDNVSFLNHLDSILKKLPIGTSENLQAKVMAMAYEELAKHREGGGGVS